MLLRERGGADVGFLEVRVAKDADFARHLLHGLTCELDDGGSKISGEAVIRLRAFEAVGEEGFPEAAP